MTETSSPYRIGVDLGGTKIKTLLLAPYDTVLRRHRIPSTAGEGYDAILSTLHRIIVETASLVPAGCPCTVGIGIPGSLDSATGLVRNANSTCLIGQPLKDDLERMLGRPVGIRNDADCFVQAECQLGAGRGYGLVFGVIMGTGCGGGFCINGLVREGPHRIAGEWGHFCVDPDGLTCYCGNRGCVETKISGSGVERAFLLKYGRKVTMEEIVAGARGGDRECQDAFDRFLDDFGRCLGGLISILDPDAVVLGGGLSGIDELYTAGIERVRSYAFHNDLRTPILRNELGDSAGVFGAAWCGEAGERLKDKG